MSFSGFKTKTIVTGLSVLVATSAFGYWSYSEYQHQELRNAVTELVKDTSVRLGDALDARTAPTSGERLKNLRRFYEHVEVVDGHYQKLQGMNVSRIGELADAADDYVLTSREILLRRASSQRNRLKLSGSIQALRNHMRADNRTGSWVTEAIRAKDRVEEDYRDYKRTIDALAKLVESFPASRTKMAPHVEAALLTDIALVEQARQQALQASRQAEEEIAKVRQLAAYRQEFEKVTR